MALHSKGGGRDAPRPPLTDEQAFEQIARTGDVLAGAHVASLDVMGELAQTRRVRMEREGRRLVKRYGDDSPEVQAAGARLERHATFEQSLAFQRARAEVPVPDVPSKGAVLYGRVLEGDGKPIDCAVVQLVPAAAAAPKEGNAAAAEPPTARSDETGAYALPLAQAPDGALRLRAARGARQPMRDFGTVRLAAGTRTYRDIVFDTPDREPCDDEEPTRPPGEGRRVKVPNVVGARVDEAAATLANAGLRIVTPELTPRGARVAAQKPVAGTTVAAGAAVAVKLGPRDPKSGARRKKG